jgi:hypothetical protein
MTLIATCHCGATRIELSGEPQGVHDCTCSFCARTGAIWGHFQRDEMRFVKQDADKVYSASGGLNQHHFCANCGMQTWGDSPDWASAYNMDGTPKPGFDSESVPEQRSYAVNLRLIDTLDLSTMAIETVDGRNNW